MSLASEWMEDHHNATRALIQQGSEALREEQNDLAYAALTEAAIVLDMHLEDSDELDQLRAQVYNELGVVHQRQEDLESARTFHEQAATLCDVLVERGHDDFKGNAAATYLNLSSITSALGDMDAALDAGNKSCERIDALLESGDATVASMATASYLTVATLKANKQDYDEANTLMTRAVELSERAIELGNPGIYAQVTQGAQQLSVVLFEQKQFESALNWGRKAEELAEEAFELFGEDALPVYIVSQINLISFNEEMRKFAAAEDCLWKAIEVVGNDPRVLKRGQDFYEKCRKQTDARLEAGNLPRAEVEEGYTDILERIEEIGGIPDNVDEE